MASHAPYALRVALDLVEAAVRTAPRLDLLVTASAAVAAPGQEAAPLFRAALAVPGADRWPFDFARVRLAYGAQLRRDRATVEARAQLAAAAATFRMLGARPWADRADNELRAAGLGVIKAAGVRLAGTWRAWMPGPGVDEQMGGGDRRVQRPAGLRRCLTRFCQQLRHPQHCPGDAHAQISGLRQPAAPLGRPRAELSCAQQRRQAVGGIAPPQNLPRQARELAGHILSAFIQAPALGWTSPLVLAMARPGSTASSAGSRNWVPTISSGWSPLLLGSTRIRRPA